MAKWPKSGEMAKIWRNGQKNGEMAKIWRKMAKWPNLAKNDINVLLISNNYFQLVTILKMARRRRSGKGKKRYGRTRVRKHKRAGRKRRRTSGKRGRTANMLGNIHPYGLAGI